MKPFLITEKAPHKIEEKLSHIFTYNKFGECHSYNKMPSVESYAKTDSFLLWTKNGEHHSYDDIPSNIKTLDMNKPVFISWSKDGYANRSGDKPAFILNNGTMIWYKNGKIDRQNDKPALISNIKKTKVWAQNGLISRAGDKPNLIIGNMLFWVVLDVKSVEYKVEKFEIKKNKNPIDYLINYPLLITTISFIIYNIVKYLFF